MSDETPFGENAPAVSGTLQDKLIAAKQSWAQQGRGLTGHPRAGTDDPRPRLPPGQRETGDWPILDLGLLPDVTPASWTLTVTGAVERPLKWQWSDFQAQPQCRFQSDIHCVTTWSRYDNQWEGVATRHLMEQAGVSSSARFVLLRSYDGYTTNLPLEYFAADDALLAHSWQGAPLTPEHGGPVRAVVPRLYFWKSAKWLRAIAFLEEDSPGYWERRGYHDRGEPWLEERYR